MTKICVDTTITLFPISERPIAMQSRVITEEEYSKLEKELVDKLNSKDKKKFVSFCGMVFRPEDVYSVDMYNSPFIEIEPEEKVTFWESIKKFFGAK